MTKQELLTKYTSLIEESAGDGFLQQTYRTITDFLSIYDMKECRRVVKLCEKAAWQDRNRPYQTEEEREWYRRKANVFQEFLDRSEKVRN